MKSSSGARRALVGAFWLSGAGYLTFAMNFGMNLLLARLLFPRDFGQFALASSFSELLSLIAGVSFPQGIIQLRDAPEVVETAYVLSLRLYAGLVLLGAAAAAVLESMHPQGRFVVLFFGLVIVRNLSVISYVYSALLEQRLDYYPVSVVRIIAGVTSVGITLVLAQMGMGVWSLLGREATLSFVTLIGLRAASRWRYRGGYNRETARRLWEFGRRMLVGRALETVWYRSDTALLGVLAGTVALGFYDRGRYLSELGHYVVSFGAVQVAFPVYARLQHNRDGLAYAHKLSHGLLVRLMCPYLVWLALFPRELVAVLYGAGTRWNDTAIILPWLAASGFLFPLVDNIKVLLTGIGRLADAVRLRLVQTGTVLLLLVPAIELGGPRGAATVVVLSQVAGLFVGYRVVRRYVCDVDFLSHARPLGAALLAGAAMAVVRGLHVLPWAGRVGDGATLLTTACLYVVCLVIVDRDHVQQYIDAIAGGFRGDVPGEAGQRAAVGVGNASKVSPNVPPHGTPEGRGSE